MGNFFKIGETFETPEGLVKCVADAPNTVCEQCVFNDKGHDGMCLKYECRSDYRPDGEDVHFEYADGEKKI